ncbi:MAG: L-seryl-tRNA(Sec) selenium transferase [Proteobacteria bacterium]|nr:L-seryl-tRNA(Sec) selenium transferase [Pseudomonadota bacterium]
MDSNRDVNRDPRRALPAVDRLAGELAADRPELPAWAVTEGARRALAVAREAAAGGGEAPSRREIAARAGAEASRLAAVHPRRVVNATGVILHTNLGRAPLAPGALAAVAAASAGYSDLELELEDGRRGNRLGRLADKLCLLSGAEAATVCNNNAAAVLLALSTLAGGPRRRQVVVSRGELVEIGGSFRVPDIMERAGVELVEVGTTNRTHPRDYENAIGPDTALLLKVHRSNFEQRGFVKDVSLQTLVEIGRARGLPVMEDLGSGTLLDLSARGFPADSHAPSRLRTGVDLICFSGDKLLGGPQAGIALGRAGVIDAMRANPLARALRLDKMTLAALGWTLDALLDGRAEREIPVLRQLLEEPASLERRARSLAERLAAIAEVAPSPAPAVAVEADRAPVGGGSLPGFELDTWIVAVRPGAGAGAADLAAKLRRASVPVLARIRDDALLFDLRSLGEGDADAVEAAFADALR